MLICGFIEGNISYLFFFVAIFKEKECFVDHLTFSFELSLEMEQQPVKLLFAVAIFIILTQTFTQSNAVNVRNNIMYKARIYMGEKVQAGAGILRHHLQFLDFVPGRVLSVPFCGGTVLSSRYTFGLQIIAKGKNQIGEHG